MTKKPTSAQQKVLSDIEKYTLNDLSFSGHELRSVKCLVKHGFVIETDCGYKAVKNINGK